MLFNFYYRSISCICLPTLFRLQKLIARPVSRARKYPFKCASLQGPFVRNKIKEFITEMKNPNAFQKPIKAIIDRYHAVQHLLTGIYSTLLLFLHMYPFPAKQYT